MSAKKAGVVMQDVECRTQGARKRRAKRANAKVLVRVRQRRRLSIEEIGAALLTLTPDHPAALAIEDWLDMALDDLVLASCSAMSDSEMRVWKGQLATVVQFKQQWEQMRSTRAVVRRAG